MLFKDYNLVDSKALQKFKRYFKYIINRSLNRVIISAIS